MGNPRKRTAKTAVLEPTSVADALFTKGQQRVLGVLFGNPDRSYYTGEIIALSDTGTGAVQRVLARLESAGLLTVSHVGNQKRYQANHAASVFTQLHELALKTFGLADILRDAVSPLASQIDAAFVYGSTAKGEDSATSDVDLMVVSDSVSYGDIYLRLEDAAARLGRKINPTIYSRAALRKGVKDRNAFVTRVLAQPKIWLLGDESELTAR
jgi:predicted nucleotidyltransferase